MSNKGGSDYDSDKLLELCESENLTYDALQEKINDLGPRVSSQSPLCFHEACYNEKVTLEIVQLLCNTRPDALRLPSHYGCLPIHMLCYNKDLDETASIDILRFMIDVDSTLPREMNGNGDLPIHNAVCYKSTVFCKVLIDAYPE